MKYSSIGIDPGDLQKHYGRILVVGDIHSDLKSEKYIFEKVFKNPKLYEKSDLIIFLGDYADRGADGPEVILSLIEIRRLYPQNVLLIKGNHESYSDDGKPKFRPCDLCNQVQDWPKMFYTVYKPFFDSLSLSIMIMGKYLFVHGGISSKIKSTVDLVKATPEIETDILWSDPADISFSGEYPNPRGCGICFGENITNDVMEALQINKIIRSHQPGLAFDRPYYNHHGKIITLNTSSYYGTPFILSIDTQTWQESVIQLNHDT